MNAFKKLAFISALLAGALVGCGGGGSSTAGGSTLGGTAAVGSPIVGGTIALVCAAGSAPASVTTGTLGDWSVTLTGQTLPCVVQVSGGTINGVANTTSYHSVANTAGTVNVTPITDLVVSNLAGSGTPATWFAGLNAAAVSPLTPTAVTAALTQVKTALGLSALTAINPLTISFNPASGNAMDDVLTALQGAMATNGTTLATLRTAASGATFTPPAGFSTAMNTAHGTTSSGGASAPAAPTGLVASGATANTMNLSWAAVSGATGYNVYQSTSAGFAIAAANKITLNSIPNTAITRSGLTAATTYYYKVTALSPAGESVGSSEATSTTLAATTTGGGTTSTANVPTGFTVRANPVGALSLAPSAVVWTGTLFIALEPNQNYHSLTATPYSWTSADGINWTRNTTNLPNNVGQGLTAANGKAFMMISLSGTTPTASIYSSTDGITWAATTGIAVNNGVNTVSSAIGVKYLNGKYFASMDVDSCNAIVSSDGTSWKTTGLSSLALPSGYQKYPNNTYCSEPFYLGGKYIITGGVIYSYTGSGANLVQSYKGLVYSSADGATWTVNTFNLPSTINAIWQSGRNGLTSQFGSNLVLSSLITNTTVNGTQVSSNYQTGISTDGLTYTFSAFSGTPNLQMLGNLSTNPSLDLPSGRVSFNLAYVNNVANYTYFYTTDGYTFTAAPDLMFTNPLMAAYSPTLKRLVVIRQESNATTFAQTGVTLATYDFP